MEFLPLIVLALLFWLLVIRPQRRRSIHQARLIDSLQRGEEVVTSGGLYGRIERIDEAEIRLEIAPGTSVRVDKRAVTARVEESPPEADPG